MGLLDRTTDLATRRIDRLLDDLEDPADAAAYDDERLRDELDALDSAVVDLVTERKRLEARVDRLDDRIDDHEERARTAVADGNEALAREILVRKREDERRRDDAAARADELRSAETELKERRATLHERVERTRARRAERTAEEQVARAEATVEELSSPDRVEEAEARAAALEELREQGFFGDGNLDDELSRERTEAEVEAELETLREQIRGDDE